MYGNFKYLGRNKQTKKMFKINFMLNKLKM